MNDNKTEYLPVVPRAASALVGSSVIRVGDVTIFASRSVRNLGVVMDRHLDLKKQVSSIVSVCSFHLRRFNRMSRYLPMTTKERVFNAIFTSRLDYCNSLLYGTCVNNIARLQRMHNTAASLILRRPRSDSATPLLCSLHWLPVARRIEFKFKVTKLPKKVTEKYCNNIVLFKYHILNTKVHSCTFSLILEHNKILLLKK